MPMRELNKKLSSISRVVVHPKYRTIGLGSKLVKETLDIAGTEHVEMSAVMAKYNPFAEKAGMKKIVEQEPPKEALAILRVLQGLDFNDQNLASEKRALEKLQTLDDNSVERIKQAFVKHNHPRFMKAFSYHLPFGAKQTYREQMEHLNLDKLAHLIKICSFLMQTKVYVFWQRT
jgi:ABC-type ATPase with predicted acetyltransferase domain